MTRNHRSTSIITIVGITCFGVFLCNAGEVPPRGPSGQSLRIPPDQQTLGEVYHVISGAGTQVTWETDARLLRLVATCNRAVGYVVAQFDLEEGQPPVLAGAVRVPVASLTTGAEQYDASLHAADMLDLEQYPEILVSLVSAGPARNVVIENRIEQCEFTLVGGLTVKDKTVRFESPASMALLPFANATQQFSPSDLMMLRTGLTVVLADLGITTESPLGAGFTSKNVTIGLYFMCTTLAPEFNFDPRVDDKMYVKHLQFITRLRDFNNPDDAYPYGRALLKEIWDDSRLLNDLAWEVLTGEQIKRRDLAFIEQAARRSNELSDHKEATYLHTLARLHYERGDLDAALKYQKLAVENLAGQPFYIAPPIKASLAEFEAEVKRRAGTGD
jgi:hypothetical protein